MSTTTITTEEFRLTSKSQCGWYSEPCDGELVWCTNPDNKCDTEGNCTQQDCPILDHIKELNEAGKIFVRHMRWTQCL